MHENNGARLEGCGAPRAQAALELLQDPSFIAEAGSVVTSHGHGHLGIEARGLLRRHREKYRFRAHRQGPCRLLLCLESDRCRIEMGFRAGPNGVVVERTLYKGPQSGFMRRVVRELARELAREAWRRASAGMKPSAAPGKEGKPRKEMAPQGPPFAEMLAPILEGGLPGLVQRIVSGHACPGGYLITGEGALGMFRVSMPEGGEARACYWPAGGGMICGEEALRSVEGLFTVRAYCLGEEGGEA